MTIKHFPAIAAAFALSGCGAHVGAGNTGALPLAQAPLAQEQSQDTIIDATITPLVIHIGFEHGEHTDRTFGPVYFYSPLRTGTAEVIRVRTGSKLVFVNDDPNRVDHTASGFGPRAFPLTFDNNSGMHRSGSTINSTLTWSTGTLVPGAHSQVFTIGPRGHYFFGCAFHYTTKPTTTNGSMGDVIVSM